MAVVLLIIYLAHALGRTYGMSGRATVLWYGAGGFAGAGGFSGGGFRAAVAAAFSGGGGSFGGGGASGGW